MFFRKTTRYLVGCIGRQWGKTVHAIMRLFHRALGKHGIYWWISPTFPQARVAFNRMCTYYKPIIAKIDRSHYELTLLNGSIIACKGSDKPDNLRGETLSGAVLDECASMRSEVWPEIVRPMLAVKLGWCDFIGTPKGKNWFFDLWNYAHTDSDWSTFHAASNSSPFFSEEEFQAARRSLPERIFRQEYLAEFLDDDSEVFRGVRECISGTLERPVLRRPYIMGVDLAKTVDFTVITVWDVNRKHMVGFERFNEVDWNLQEARIEHFATSYNNATIVLDATGVGDPIYDKLCAKGLNIVPVKFTNIVKANLIRTLSIAIQKREITFPEIPEVISELQIFSSETLPKSGAIRYGAPPGYHDDCVISMALAVTELQAYGPIEIEGVGRRVMVDYLNA